MSTVYLNTKAFCKLTPVFNLTYFTSTEDEDPVKSITIDRSKKYNISAYKDETGQLLDYTGRIVRVNIRYNPNSTFIPLDGREEDLEIISILLDCSTDCGSKVVLINVCDIRAISEYTTEIITPEEPGTEEPEPEEPEDPSTEDPSTDPEEPGTEDPGTEEPEVPDTDPEPTTKTVYTGSLPTFWNSDGDDTIDLTKNDITTDMIKSLSSYQQSGKEISITAEAVEDSPSQWAYAYPKEWGTLSHFYSSGFDYITNFDTTELNIDGVSYIVYFNSTTSTITITYVIS